MILIYRLLSCSLLPCQSSFIANERELNNLQYHRTKKLSSNVTAMIADIVVYRGPITLIEHLFLLWTFERCSVHLFSIMSWKWRQICSAPPPDRWYFVLCQKIACKPRRLLLNLFRCNKLVGKVTFVLIVTLKKSYDTCMEWVR